MSQHRYLLIVVDVATSTVADLYSQALLVRLYAHLLQDLSMLFSLLLILLQFFSKDILRGRLLGKVLARHWHLPASSFLYLGLTLSQQALHGLYWRHSSVGPSQLVYTLIHRLVAVLYYFALARPISLSHSEHNGPQRDSDLSSC